MRRSVIVVGLVVVTAIAGAVAYRLSFWKDYHYPGTRLMVDLGRPDAVIRTDSLSRLPRDLLQAPIAKDVLTEDLVFYYEQNEDRLGLNGAIKRIAYEHQLGWTDKLLASALDESAEVALWRDGKGALRHFAIVMRRNALSKVIQEAATVAMKDSQLTKAGEISTANGKAHAYALALNPRRTLLLITQGERIVVLSDPGLLFDKDDDMLSAARNAIAEWLDNDGALAKKFVLDDISMATKPQHTLAIGAPTLALGYGAFMSGFKGLRFDFAQTWSTSVWLDPHGSLAKEMDNAALWRAAPANPSACTVLPVDWKAVQTVLSEVPHNAALPELDTLALFNGPALACWYGESSLYSPVFITRLADGLDASSRNAVLQHLASWAIAATPSEEGKAAGGKKKNSSTARAGKHDVTIWRKVNVDKKDGKPGQSAPTVAAYGQYVVFSPDGALVDLVIDTLDRTHPSVADQMPASNTTFMLFTPSRLAAMSQKEILAALSDPADANLLAAAQTHLPARMKALAAYPPYRLDLPALLRVPVKAPKPWQHVQWRTPGEGR